MFNRQPKASSNEVTLSVPGKNDQIAQNSAGATQSTSSATPSNGAKYDKNGKQIVAKSSKLAQIGKKLSRKQLIAIIVAAVLLVAALITGIVLLVNHNSAPQENDDTSVQEPAEPEEPEPLENKDPLAAEPDDIDPENYHVAAYKPRFVSIPALSLNNIPVTEVGWINGNQLGSPKSTRVAGWFYRSAIPGERGPAIINAHGGDLGTGIFKTLPKIQMGNEVIIEMGDGRKFTYVVEEIAFKKLGDEANQWMNVAFQVLHEGVPSLTLITCTGTWLPNLQTYDQRLFVRASMK